MSPARGRALAGAFALAAATAAWAGPGAAPAAAYVCSLTVDTPTPNAAADTSTVRFAGSFTAIPSPEGRTLELSFSSGPGPLPPAVTWSDGDPGGPERYEVDVGGLTHNGTYTAQVKATHTAGSDDECQGGEGAAKPTTVTKEVVFGVSVQAKPPANVRARFEAAPRSAVVTWEKSPDPDTAGYSLSRKVGSGDFQRLRDVPPGTGSWTDTALPAGAATITYAVSSSRVGAGPGTTSLASPRVAAAPLEVPAAPATTSTSKAVTGATPTPRDAATPGDRTADRRLAAPSPAPFVLGRPVGGSAGPPELDFPDGLADPEGGQAIPGDEPVLRYRPNLGDDQVQLPDDSDQAFAAGQRGVGDDGTPQLAYVAAGLLTAVVAAHVLWLRNQAMRPAADVVETAVPLEPVVLAPVPERAPPPPPADEVDGAAAPARPAAPVVVRTAAPPLERFAPPAERVVPPRAERVAPPRVEPVAPPRAERAARPRAERAVPLVAAPAAAAAAAPVPEPAAPPRAEGAALPGAERAAPPRAEGAAPPRAERVARPRAERAVPLVAAAAAAPVPEPAAPPVAEAVAPPSGAPAEPAPPAPKRAGSRPILVIRAPGKAAPAGGAQP